MDTSSAGQQQQLAPSRWRKRPVEIEAMQWAGTMQSASAIYAWAREHGVRMGPVSDPVHETCIQIPTLEGDMRAAPDDWIIRGVQGEFYPCKPDIFAATYEAVTESNDSRDTRDIPSESRVTATDTASERRETDTESNDSRPEELPSTGPAFRMSKAGHILCAKCNRHADQCSCREHGFVEHDYECPDCGESMGHGSSGGTAIYTAFACGNVREYNRGVVTHTGDCNNPVRGENVPDPTVCTCPDSVSGHLEGCPNQAVDYDCDVCGLIGYECVHLRDFRLAMEAGRQERFQPCGYCGAGTARPICKGQCFEGRLAPNPCESCAGTGRIGSFRCKCSDTDGHLAPCGHPITSLRDMGEASGHYCHDCAVEKRDQRIACTTTKTCTCGHAQREHRERDNPPGPSWFSTCSKCACRSYKEDGLQT